MHLAFARSPPTNQGYQYQYQSQARWDGLRGHRLEACHCAAGAPVATGLNYASVPVWQRQGVYWVGAVLAFHRKQHKQEYDGGVGVMLFLAK